MFAGLSAFPLTPLREDKFDEKSFEGLVSRLVAAEVDSITALGSTGSYAYLDRDERRRVIRSAVQNSHTIPVIAGIGALRTSHVQALAEDAQEAGASAVLLAPVSYQKLTEDDVYGFYEDVVGGLSVPLVVYDNPGTTHFAFSTELYARVASLPNVESIKIPGVPVDIDAARERVNTIRAVVPAHMSIGIAGDAAAAIGLTAGCDVWYSVIAGTLPSLASIITCAVREGKNDEAAAESARLQPLWELFAQHGSLRVTAAIAEQLKLVPERSLPAPIRGLNPDERERVAEVIEALGLRD